MMRFQRLLTSDVTPDPGDDQRRASASLPGLVRGSRLRWWAGGHGAPEDSLLLIMVAVYSQYDLALLDILEEDPRPSAAIPIYVADLQQYESIEQIRRDVPIISKAPSQSPVVAVRDRGRWTEGAWGKPGRDLVATTLGLSPAELTDRVVERVRPFIGR